MGGLGHVYTSDNRTGNIVDLSGIMIVKNRIVLWSSLSIFFFVKVLSRQPIWGGVGVSYILYIDLSN